MGSARPTYYSDRSKRLVADRYALDIELLGYESW